MLRAVISLGLAKAPYAVEKLAGLGHVRLAKEEQVIVDALGDRRLASVIKRALNDPSALSQSLAVKELGNRRDRQASQNYDDRNHDQQLNERKSSTSLHRTTPG
jgi:hypothetical protein